MTEDDLKPVKRVVTVEQFRDLEWLTPVTADHLIKIITEKDLPVAKMKRWCEQHCSDTVAIWTSAGSPVYFGFFDSTEAVAFKLRWL